MVNNRRKKSTSSGLVGSAVNTNNTRINGYTVPNNSKQTNGFAKVNCHKEVQINGYHTESDRDSSSSQAPPSGSSRRSTVSSLTSEKKQITCNSDSNRSRTDSVSDDCLARISPDASPCCSTDGVTGTGCQTDALTNDGVLSFISMSEWDQVETLCELVSCLGAYELRLLASCVEGAARCQAPMLRQHELRANSPTFIQSLISPSAKYPYSQKVDCAYAVVTLMSSTNRQGAYALIKLIDHLLTFRDDEVGKIDTVSERRKTISTLGKLVTAALHHPAFSIDQRIRLVHARDDMRNKLNRMTSPEPSPTRPSSSGEGLVFIRRFEASIPDINDQNWFLIEMIWSDGERTWVGRTRQEINALHHRLLDLFGEERREQLREKKAVGEHSSQSTPSDSPIPSDSVEQSSSSSGFSPLRILPYFSAEATPQAVVQYLNGLSDLPARMMLSSVIYKEFFASRLNSGDIENSERPGRRDSRSPPIPLHKTPISAPPTYPIVTHPMCYGPAGNLPVLQVQNPSCSNCAGPHAFVLCNKESVLDKSGFFKLDIHGQDSSGDSTVSSKSSECQQIPFVDQPPPGLSGPGMSAVQRMLTGPIPQPIPDRVPIHPMYPHPVMVPVLFQGPHLPQI